MARKSLTKSSLDIVERIGCFAFASVFLLAGLLGMWITTIGPLIQIYQAQSWQPTKCGVLTSEVRTYEDSDGDTYSVDITYSYLFNGVRYEGNQYDFGFGSSSGYKKKAEIVARHPPGAEILCFVDPEDPTSSVIHPKPDTYLLWGLIPLALFLGGVAVVATQFGSKASGPFDGRAVRLAPRASSSRSVESRKTQGEEVAARLTDAVNSSRGRFNEGASGLTTKRGAPPALPRFKRGAVGVSGGRGPIELKSEPSTRIGAFVALLIFATIWNIGVYWFWGSELRSIQELDWFVLLFMSPFVLAGIGLIGMATYHGLGIFNPHVHLTISDSDLRMGGSYSVRWQISGRSDRLRKLTIRLEGLEKTIYRRGTETTTDHSVFYREVLMEDAHLRFLKGSFKMNLPGDSMPTFLAPNNEIRWCLKVAGDVPWWPDVKEEFPLALSFRSPDDPGRRP